MLVALAAGGLIPSCFMAQMAATAAPGPGAPHPAVDVTACQTCHEDAVKGMRGTRHTGVEGSCAACHGDVAGHLKSIQDKGGPGPILSLETMKPRR